MGLEATCDVRIDGRTVAGKAHLETDRLLFRGGDVSLSIPLKKMSDVAARRGRLELSFAGRQASLALGPDAEKWALKIRYPRSLMDKLGVKTGSKVSVVGLDDEEVLRQLRERAEDVSLGRARRGSDVVLARIASRAELTRLARLRGSLKPNGALWTVWAKGQKALTEDHVRAAALAVGLVDVKVVSVSETLSGLKLVIPLASR